MRLKNRKALAPVIANLLLVALAVIGGTITVVFAQGNYNSEQISGAPSLELVRIMGYDARDIRPLIAHDGNSLSWELSGAYVGDGFKGVEERIVVYVKNDSIKKIILKEVSFVGSELNYFNPPEKFVPNGSYSILTKHNQLENMLQSEVAIIQPGEEVSLVIGLDSQFKVGRLAQLKLTTAENTVAVTTIVIGDSKF